MRRDGARVRARAGPALLVTLAVAIATGCGTDVIVGRNAGVTGTGTGGGADASVDGGSPDAADGGATTGGALTAVAREAGEIFAVGWEGAQAPRDAASDVWLGRLGEGGAEQSGGRLDFGGGADAASSVTTIGGASWIVGGAVTSGATRRAWLRRVGPGDVEVWTKQIDPVDPGATAAEVTGLARGRFGTTVVAVGNDTSPSGAVDGWVARLDLDGNVAWKISNRASSPSEPSKRDTAYFAVAVNDLDQTFAVGRRLVIAADSSQSQQPVIVKFDQDGNISSSSTGLAGPTTPGVARSVIAVGNVTQQVYVCLEAEGGIRVVHYDFAFSVLGSHTYTDPRGALSLGACAQTSDGAILVVGSVALASGPEPWASKLGLAPIAPIWTRAIPSPAGPAHAAAVASDGAGGGLAVGYTAAGRRWVGVVSP